MLPISSEKETVPKRLVFLQSYKCVGYGLFCLPSDIAVRGRY